MGTYNADPVPVGCEIVFLVGVHAGEDVVLFFR
jgi:hypothetical protein